MPLPRGQVPRKIAVQAQYLSQLRWENRCSNTVLTWTSGNLQGDTAMEAEQTQNKGGLDALAARLDARYKQERKARAAGEEFFGLPDASLVSASMRIEKE